jgi:hypothetical protein
MDHKKIVVSNVDGKKNMFRRRDSKKMVNQNFLGKIKLY